MSRWCECEVPLTRSIATNRCLKCGKIIRTEKEAAKT